ncbi:hypothetical protein [Streptomyces sp. SAS_267]|uniref:hypothetical protein n=1 Tax=Streptomyces sp. SAS_267 TaxID=3412750 RepID=UPI00403C97FD
MTAGAREPMVRSERADGGEYGDAAGRWAAPPVCVITADGTYGARLARDGESWYPERWTLDGPEPYAVPLPGPQPEEPGTEVLPLTDGRVLIHRVDDGRHAFSLLYPTGPGTGELPLGAVECPDAGTVLRLLPPAPDGERAYALAVGRGSTAVWLVAGGAFGPEHLAEVPGHCSGGVWLDGTGRLLALDRLQNGRTKTVVVDLERGGEVSPLLQIAEHSNDRLLLADADSGLLLIRSDAPSPGRDRLGWGVLGSTLPVRFPDCLTATGCSVSPFAIQPGQVLTPESCAVALRMDGPGGTWVGVWRPAERRIHHSPAPEGWFAGTGVWTAEGVLRLPYATGGVPCGVARLGAPEGAGEPDTGVPAPPGPPAPRTVPLQQAPLRSGRPDGSPHPAREAVPPRALPVHLALSSGTVRAPGDEAVRPVEGPRVSSAGTGPAPEGREPLSTVTSLTPRTAPTSPASPASSVEAWRADPDPGHEPGGTLPPVVRPADETHEPPRPVVRRAAPASGEPAARPQPSRWTRVFLTPAPAPERRPAPAGTPAAEANLWTKVAETPPPGMGLRTRADGTLPGGMTVVVETAQPLPPVRRVGAGSGSGTHAMAAAGPATDPGRGPAARTAADTGTEADATAGSGAGAVPGSGAAVSPGDRADVAPRTGARTGADGTPSAEGPLPAEPLPPVLGHRARTAEPLPAVAGPSAETAEPLPSNPWAGVAGVSGGSATDPGLWTKVAETPPPGMSLGTRAGTTPAGGTVLGEGTIDALPAVGAFRGQVVLRPAVGRPGSDAQPASGLTTVSGTLAALPRTPPESGGPCVPAHTDEEKRGSMGEETSPSDSRAMTAR